MILSIRRVAGKYSAVAISTIMQRKETRILTHGRSAFWLYGKQREVLAYAQTVMLKTMKCQVRVVWVYRKTRYVALMTTDLTLSVEQIIEYYGARWKIEAGFKEIKQEIGSAKSQTRNADAVLNHLNFCMMATTLTWIYADRLQYAPDRKYKIRGRSGFPIDLPIADAKATKIFHQNVAAHGSLKKTRFGLLKNLRKLQFKNEFREGTYPPLWGDFIKNQGCKR